MPRISKIPPACSSAFTGRQQSVPSFNRGMKILLSACCPSLCRRFLQHPRHRFHVKLNFDYRETGEHLQRRRVAPA